MPNPDELTLRIARFDELTPALKRAVVAALSAKLAAVEEENLVLRGMLRGAMDRIGAQSELLSRAAERKVPK